MPPKKVAPKKVSKPVEEVKVAQPAPETTPVVEASSDDSSSNELSEQFAEFMGRLTTMRTQISSLLTDFRALQKKAERELKAVQKANNKRKRKVSNRQPSGFVKPTQISDQLADFLGKPKGSELARTEVTREINAYIRANNLQDPSNGSKINPDKKLKTLLSLKSSDELTYFNLQKFMSPHFAKAGAPPLASA